MLTRSSSLTSRVKSETIGARFTHVKKIAEQKNITSLSLTQRNTCFVPRLRDGKGASPGSDKALICTSCEILFSGFPPPDSFPFRFELRDGPGVGGEKTSKGVVWEEGGVKSIKKGLKFQQIWEVEVTLSDLETSFGGSITNISTENGMKKKKNVRMEGSRLSATSRLLEGGCVET
ncbi:hypothetical protein CEXT_382931 [Caerostris extrusa]|uniref:Uncharacterized protein n=1 Tax=Caerostris extrusa TaxID=172846 RepID=A0AAV4W2C4_CAEEX|nr:hypothetical protein CEXT_382931 [Caerostris extrusa]